MHAVKKLLTVLAFGLIFSVVVFSQNDPIPNGLGLGYSIGERGGDWAVGINATSPYVQITKTFFWTVRASGDVLLKEGVPVGDNVETRKPYFTARLGSVEAIVPNNFMRLYAEVGGLGVFPNSNVASSTNPSFGAYGHFGGEVFITSAKHASIFCEIGDELTFNAAGADKFQGSPTLATGPSVASGVRFNL
jgi:hypothetical protein